MPLSERPLLAEGGLLAALILMPVSVCIVRERPLEAWLGLTVSVR